MSARLFLALVVAASALSAATAAPVATAVPVDATAVPVDSLASQVGAQEEPLSDGVTVYYFHRTIRCVTCIAAEALADTLMRRDFAAELQSGALTWLVVNVDKGANDRFADTYELGPFGLIVSVRMGGEELYWRELKSIEDLVEYQGLFAEYVGGEIRYTLDMLQGEVSRDATRQGGAGVLPAPPR